MADPALELLCFRESILQMDRVIIAGYVRKLQQVLFRESSRRQKFSPALIRQWLSVLCLSFCASSSMYCSEEKIHDSSVTARRISRECPTPRPGTPKSMLAGLSRRTGKTDAPSEEEQVFPLKACLFGDARQCKMP
jgi:hypothetical protein